MKFSIENTILTKHLQKINRVLVKNISYPILENILIKIHNGILSLTATDLEIELVSYTSISKKYPEGSVTCSGKKLLNICRHTEKKTDIYIKLIQNKIHVTAEKSKFVLNSLPSDNFPKKNNFVYISEFFIHANIIKNMIEKTGFSMGKQDVRPYLNGILLEKEKNLLYSVTTDGYRLSQAYTNIKQEIISFSSIIPRKGILELYKLLSFSNELIHVFIGNKNIKIHMKNCIFTTQLIEGKYPDYKNVFMKKKENGILLNCMLLKQSLLRVAIVSDDRFCRIEIHISKNQFRVLSGNQDEESAEDTFKITYEYDTPIIIAVNVYYILDVLNVIKSEHIYLFVNQAYASIQIEPKNDSSNTYIVMLLKN